MINIKKCLEERLSNVIPKPNQLILFDFAILIICSLHSKQNFKTIDSLTIGGHCENCDRKWIRWFTLYIIYRHDAHKYSWKGAKNWLKMERYQNSHVEHNMCLVQSKSLSWTSLTIPSPPHERKPFDTTWISVTAACSVSNFFHKFKCKLYPKM